MAIGFAMGFAIGFAGGVVGASVEVNHKVLVLGHSMPRPQRLPRKLLLGFPRDNLRQTHAVIQNSSVEVIRNLALL